MPFVVMTSEPARTVAKCLGSVRGFALFRIPGLPGCRIVASWPSEHVLSSTLCNLPPEAGHIESVLNEPG